MNIIRPNTCATCAFKFRNGQELQCRAKTPSVSPILQADKFGRPIIAGNVTMFPVVMGDWWCGEWKAVAASALNVDNGLERPAYAGAAQ